jgi:DNA-binding CsgD family transcriptional regulator/N-acetylneuraminic acid mutarotase
MPEYGEPLSEREQEVLELVATGATNRQVAHDLVLSVNTVKVHLRNIFVKLGVESRTEASMIAIREGWIGVPSEEELGLESEDQTEAVAPEPAALPPLPWPKRVALIVSLMLVIAATAVTWPRSRTFAVLDSPDSDTMMSNGINTNLIVTDTEWQPLAPMTTARSRFALATAPSGQLFALGGETNGGITDSIEQYDPNTGQWTLLPQNKPTRVSNIGTGIIGEYLYVPGGLTVEGEATSVVEAYHLTRQEWIQVASLPQPVYAYALTIHRGKLYLFGGRDNRGYVNLTWVYDPAEDSWQDGKPMPTRRAYAGAAALGPRLFVVGGYDGQRELSTCESYRPAEETWERCEPMTQPRGGLGLAAVANRLYAVGGGWSNYLGFNETFNPEDNRWTPFETPVSRQWRNIATAATPNKFYAAGGWNGEYLNGVWEYVALPYTIFIPSTSQ